MCGFVLCWHAYSMHLHLTGEEAQADSEEDGQDDEYEHVQIGNAVCPMSPVVYTCHAMVE